MKYPSIATRNSLLTRLKDWDDQEGWKRFFETYWRLIYNVAIHHGLSEIEAQEVVQETVLSVANKMRQFKYDPAIGSFKSWLFKLTRWRIADQMRKRRPDHVSLEMLPSTTENTEVMRGLEAEWERRWDENFVEAAVERVKQLVSARQFQLFYLYVLKGWPVSEVARALNVTSAQVYIAKCRVLPLLKKEVKRLHTEFI